MLWQKLAITLPAVSTGEGARVAINDTSVARITTLKLSARNAAALYLRRAAEPERLYHGLVEIQAFLVNAICRQVWPRRACARSYSTSAQSRLSLVVGVRMRATWHQAAISTALSLFSNASPAAARWTFIERRRPRIRVHEKGERRVFLFWWKFNYRLVDPSSGLAECQRLACLCCHVFAHEHVTAVSLATAYTRYFSLRSYETPRYTAIVLCCDSENMKMFIFYLLGRAIFDRAKLKRGINVFTTRVAQFWIFLITRLVTMLTSPIALGKNSSNRDIDKPDGRYTVGFFSFFAIGNSLT